MRTRVYFFSILVQNKQGREINFTAHGEATSGAASGGGSATAATGVPASRGGTATRASGGCGSAAGSAAAVTPGAAIGSSGHWSGTDGGTSAVRGGGGGGSGLAPPLRLRAGSAATAP